MADLCLKFYLKQFNCVSLKKASIIIGDILNFDSTIYESWKYKILRQKWAFKAPWISLDF
jgi:hypothetical protein